MKTPFSALESSDTKFWSENKRDQEKKSKLERETDILYSAKKNTKSNIGSRIQSTNKKLNFNKIDEESYDNNSPPRKVEFDVFRDNVNDLDFENDKNASREYHYFDVNNWTNSQKSIKSEESDKIFNNVRMKQESSANKMQASSPDLNFVSPEMEGRNRGKMSNDVFDYNSIRKKHSFDYSDNDCQATPTKRNTRSSKNKDLLSPVTRVLGLDSNSKVTIKNNIL